MWKKVRFILGRFVIRTGAILGELVYPDLTDMTYDDMNYFGKLAVTLMISGWKIAGLSIERLNNAVAEYKKSKAKET